MKPRSYKGLRDLHAMLDLLSEGAKADTGSHYIHRGDLQWWLFYTDVPQEIWQSNIRLWMDGDRLVGWALLLQEEKTFDVCVDPSLRGDPREREILMYAASEMSTLDFVESYWIAGNDEVRAQWFGHNGFEPKQKHFIHFSRSLNGSVPESPLPDGFHIRASRGTEEDARLRSMASHAAFDSNKPFEEYWPRTWRFMRSPVYVPEHELFVMSPDGQVAAYCIVWTDELTRVGHFEPVGTHPNYQRKGLGKSLLFEAMRRLKSEGMTEADVCTNYDNEGAIRLYETVGFRKSKKLLIYQKRK
ncbi:MAG TPA: GNAT family N-acetyltransferase [Anaerolineales bacterium]